MQSISPLFSHSLTAVSPRVLLCCSSRRQRLHSDVVRRSVTLMYAKLPNQGCFTCLHLAQIPLKTIVFCAPVSFKCCNCICFNHFLRQLIPCTHIPECEKLPLVSLLNLSPLTSNLCLLVLDSPSLGKMTIQLISGPHGFIYLNRYPSTSSAPGNERPATLHNFSYTLYSLMRCFL